MRRSNKQPAASAPPPPAAEAETTNPSAPDEHWTRAQFVRVAAGTGLGLALGGGGYGAYRLFDGRSSLSADPPSATDAVHHFRSRPDLAPPKVTVVGGSGDARLGSILLTPLTGPGQRGTLIIDERGHPLWFRPSTPVAPDASNLAVSTYKGKPVLTWWEGRLVGGVGRGSYVVADSQYRTIARFTAGYGYDGDLHEFRLTPHGTALVTVQRIIRTDLRSVGGARDGELRDMGFQEIDVATGEVVRHWSGVGRIAFTESYKKPPASGVFDYLHLNSIDVAADGTILLSARHTWTLYRVDPHSGAILWRLGGKRSDFAVATAARFAWQHDARWRDPNTITLFDDGAAPDGIIERQSRGLVLDLDISGRRVTAGRSYTHTPKLLATAMGSLQSLSGGATLVGWGTEPYVTAYAADGSVLLDAKLPRRGSSYRALAGDWAGRPSDRPRVALGPSAGASRLYVSWNGATEVVGWQLHTGTTATHLTAGNTTPRTGFETLIDVPSGARYASIVALDANGAPLGSSPTTEL